MLQWISTRHFPYISGDSGRFEHKALIGIGGNIGNMPRRFEALWRLWRQNPQVEILETGHILINPPFGYLDQPDFHNSVMVVSTRLDPFELLRFMLYTEHRFGRKRSFADAPRSLDLDLIFYDNIEVDTFRLQLPHPHWQERDSVVLPMMSLKGSQW